MESEIQDVNPAEMSGLTNEMRISSLKKPDNFFVEHKHMHEFYEMFDAIRLQGRRIRTTSMTVVAPSGGGKTTNAEAYIERRGLLSVRVGGVITRPAVVVHMPAATRPAAYSERILKTYKEPRPERGTTSQKQHRVFDVLEKAKTQLVFIDEIHHVLGYGGTSSQELMLNVLKDVANECQIPFILMGTERAREVISLNEEVKVRFPIFELNPFPEITRDFREFLAGFESMLPLKKASDIANNKKAVTEIYNFTEGLIVNVSALIRGAAITSIRSGSERIGLKEINEGKRLVEKNLVLK